MNPRQDSDFVSRKRRRLSRAFIALLLCFPFLACGADKEWIVAHEKQLNGLFEALSKSSFPPVTEAAREWSDGRHAEACSALLSYYRERTPLLSGLTPSLVLPAGSRFYSDAWIKNRTSPLGVEVDLKRLPSGDIDWHQRGPEKDKEFAWMLNRHLILPLLVSTHQLTNSEQRGPYLDAAEALIIDWVSNNPYPDRVTFSPPWRALEVARRILDSWGPSFDFLSQNIGDEALLLLLSSIPHHADALDEHASIWGGNHLLTEKISLVLIALQWPEFAESNQWLNDALEVVTDTFIAQTYPDGAYIELSNHYQKIVLQNVQQLLEILQLSGKQPPDALLERLESGWDFYAKTSKPDGSGPLNNDSDFEIGGPLIEEAALFYKRKDWLYIATFGREGEPPEKTSPNIFPWAGTAILRDSYKQTSDWAYFDTGPYGTAHQHDDKLHLSVALAGKDFLVDQGRNSYYPDDWRHYFKGPGGHNTIEFEGLAPRQRPHKRRTPINSILFADEVWSVVWGEIWNDAFPLGETPSWLHRRFVIHHKNAGFIAIDHLIGFGAKKGTIRWHFDPQLEQEQIEVDFQLHATSTPEFDLLWHRGSESPIAGWHSKQYSQKVPAWQADYTVKLNKPAVFIWAIGWAADSEILADKDTVRINTPSGTLLVELDEPSARWLPSQ